MGGAAPAWLNAANEVAVSAFLAGTLRWLGIAEVVEDALRAYQPVELDSVEAFLAGRLRFGRIIETVAQVVSEHSDSGGNAVTLADVLAADRWARARACELTGTGKGEISR